MTKRQAQVLAFIQARMPRPGRAPSYGEMAAFQGVAVGRPTSMRGRWNAKGPSPEPGTTVASA